MFRVLLLAALKARNSRLHSAPKPVQLMGAGRTCCTAMQARKPAGTKATFRVYAKLGNLGPKDERGTGWGAAGCAAPDDDGPLCPPIPRGPCSFLSIRSGFFHAFLGVGGLGASKSANASLGEGSRACQVVSTLHFQCCGSIRKPQTSACS